MPWRQEPLLVAIVMAKHGGSCVHFSGIYTRGRTSRETVSHPQRPPFTGAIFFVVENITTLNYNIGVFCSPYIVVEGRALSFAGAAVVCSMSIMASLISMKIPLDVVRVGAWNCLELQEYYKFKFKSFIASYTWQGVHRGLCNKVSHTHGNLTKHNIKKKLC